MNEIIIRDARLDDLPVLLEFEQSIISVERPFDKLLKPDPISYYDIKGLIQSTKAHVVVAEINQQLVASGYAQIRDSKPYMKHSRYAYLGFMYVETEQRGKGINQMILKALQRWSKNQNVTELNLNVYADNHAAIRAYQKAGFKSNIIEMSISIEQD